jgi:hypothetical protein
VGGEVAQGGVDWGLFPVLLCLAEVGVESLTFSWLKIGLGLIWPQVETIFNRMGT